MNKYSLGYNKKKRSGYSDIKGMDRAVRSSVNGAFNLFTGTVGLIGLLAGGGKKRRSKKWF